MFLFSTIVYFGEIPVGYDVYREEDIFQFRPTIDSKLNTEPPVVTAIYLSGYWLIDGTEDYEIMEQVKKIIGMNELIVTLNVAS